MSDAWAHVVGTAFPGRYERIIAAVHAHPDPNALSLLFADLAHFVHPEGRGSAVPGLEGNTTKKRKLDSGVPLSAVQVNGAGLPSRSNELIVRFDCKDVSFQAPVRKKLRLQILADANNATKTEVRLLHAQSGEVEYSLPASSIDQAFRLPVPDKQQRQSNFVLFPRPDAAQADGTPCEQLVFTLAEGPPTAVAKSERAVTDDDTYVTVAEHEINMLLRSHGKHVISADESEFASSIPQPHRKGEKAYHVKAHRGSKEGELVPTLLQSM